ncbi:hypothetical protein QUF64_00040 [Anaerolineales bacterium HSG6]|nr:hypothetical protein [Anaerolineales bacterium HSG6]
MNKPLTIQISEYIKQLSLDELVWLIEKLLEQVRVLISSGQSQEDSSLSLEQFVTEVQAIPPNPANIRLPHGSLAEALRDSDEDPEFDLARWKQEWAVVETEMKAITRANNAAEGFV